MNGQRRRVRSSRAALSRSLLLSAVLFAPAVQGAEVDTSGWECANCPLPVGWSSAVTVGAGYINDDSYKFGDYRGLDEEGVYAIVDGDFRYWGDSGHFLDIRATGLGLDPSLQISGGRQGLYRLRFTYDELPHTRFDTGETPFSLAGGNLRLPSDWVTAGASDALPGLDAALRPLGIKTDRDTYGLGLAFTPSGRLRFAVDYRHQEKDGAGIRSGNYISQFTQLPEPVEYRSDEVDASVSYMASNGQIRLGYYGSWFANSNTALKWDNPFTPLIAGADEGRMALPPDNQAHRVSLSGSYRWAGHTQVSGTLSTGKMTQDDALVAYTITPGLGEPALPFSSLDAEVKTTKLHLRAVNQPRRRLRFTLDYDYDDRDNETPVALFQVVQSDLYLEDDPRRNRPYSFERQKFRAQGSYRLKEGTRISAGYEHHRIERDLQEVARTEEDAVWLKFKLPRTLPFGHGASFRVFHSSRDGSTYRTPEETATFQNPLLRKFNMADRDRDQIVFDWPLSPSERLDLSLHFSKSNDDYDKSELGLQEAEWSNIFVDGSVRVGERLSLHGSVGHETYDSAQTGSESFAASDWAADNEDVIDTATLGLRWRDEDDKLDVGLDYVYARSESDITLTSPDTLTSTFPQLETRMHGATLFVDYQLRENLQLRGSIYHESYRSDDWMLDDVGVTRLPSALLFGLESPEYDVTVFGLSFTYQPGM